MKHLKQGVAVLLAALLAVPGLPVFAAESVTSGDYDSGEAAEERPVEAVLEEGVTFGITNAWLDSGKTYIYTYQQREQGSGLSFVWNCERYENGVADTETKFYDLAATHGDFGNFVSEARPNAVPKATGGVSNIYRGAYVLKSAGVQEELQALYDGTVVNAFDGTTYNALLWVFDNMYIAGEDSLEEFLNRIPCQDNFGGRRELLYRAYWNRQGSLCRNQMLRWFSKWQSGTLPIMKK